MSLNESTEVEPPTSGIHIQRSTLRMAAQIILSVFEEKEGSH